MIISILGTSGAKLDTKNCITEKDTNGDIKLFEKATYDLSILEKKEKTYLNATQLLLEEFDDKFIFIGTSCAIKFQKELLKENLKNKDVTFKEVGENDLDEVFEKIYNTLDTTEDIILDITHGFRHQPIMAIFASTLSQFLERKNLKIIFAKEEERNKRYSYIYLDDYIEITQISLLLTGFIRTLNFIPVKNLKLVNNGIFEDFSKALLSNDLKGVETQTQKLFEHLEEIHKTASLAHLTPIIVQIKEELKDLENFQDKQTYKKYLTLSKLMLDKNYLIIALSYLFESLREYCTQQFRSILDGKVKFKNGYEKNTAVMDTIGNFKRNNRPNKIQKQFPNLYDKNKSQFIRISKVYGDIRTLRNDLAHINKHKKFDDIHKNINQLLFKIESIYNDELLKNM